MTDIPEWARAVAVCEKELAQAGTPYDRVGDLGAIQARMLASHEERIRRQNRTMKRIIVALLIAGTVQWLACNFAHAQAPQPTAHERALEATVGELQQAWTAARTAWIAAQDENARLAAEVRAKTDRIAQLEAERAKAIQPPAEGK